MANKKEHLLELLAKELGYKDVKKLRDKLKEDGGTGGKEGSTGKKSGSLQSRLESGQGFGEAISGVSKEKIQSVKKAFTKEGIKSGIKSAGRKAYMDVFSGQDIFSAYMRGRIAKGEKKGKDDEKVLGDGPEKLGGESSSFLKIIAKESMAIPGMARDTNVLRQNLQKLVKLWGGKAAGRKDAHFLKSGEREEKLQVQSQSERAKDLEFFKSQDEKEAELEKKDTDPTIIQQTEDGKKEKSGGLLGGLLDIILTLFKVRMIFALSKLLNPMAILKLIGKVFVIGTLLISLFKGITAAFDKWKETGSLKEAIISGLGAIVDFLTFGFFGEDSIKNLFDTVEDFLGPIIDTIKGYLKPVMDVIDEYVSPVIETASDILKKIGNWIADNVGIPKISIPLPEWAQKIGAPKEFSIGPYYPFKGLKETAPAAEKPSTPKGAAPETPAKGAAPGQTPSTPAGTTAPGKVSPTPEKSGSPLKLPKGVTWDPNTGFYEKNGVRFSADSQDVLDEKAKTFDTGKPYKWEYVDPTTGGKKSQMFNGAELAGTAGAAPDELKISTSTPSATPSAEATGGAGGTAPSATAPSTGGDGGVTPSSSSTGGAEPSSGTPPSAPSGGASAPSTATSSAGDTSTTTGGGSVSGTPTASSAGVTPPTPAAPSTDSGSQISSASTDVAEKQRMESSAEQGMTVNNSTTNNSSQNSGMEKTRVADVYDAEFMRTYATT